MKGHAQAKTEVTGGVSDSGEREMIVESRSKFFKYRRSVNETQQSIE